jgi:hypothetical protein
MLPSPGWRVGCPRRSSNWTSFPSPWVRAWEGHEVVDRHQQVDETGERGAKNLNPRENKVCSKEFAAEKTSAPIPATKHVGDMGAREKLSR